MNIILPSIVEKKILTNTIKFALCTLIFVSIVFPSGTIYTINLKIVITSILFLSLMIFYIKHEVPMKFFVLLLSFLVFLFITSLIAVLNDIPVFSILSEMKAFIATFYLIFLPLLIIESNIITSLQTLKVIAYSTLCYLLIKLTLEILLIFGFLDINNLYLFINDVFNFKFIHLPFSIFERINFPIDYILPPLLLAILYSKNLGWNLIYFQKIIFFILILSAIFIAYSRYLWAFTFLIILLYFFTEKITYKKLNYFLGFSILLLMIAILYHEIIVGIIEERFLGSYTTVSDLPRIEMKVALSEMIHNMPITGWGMGAYPNSLVRFEQSPWNYELQWFAFLMQFGYLGILYLLFLTGLVYKKIFIRLTRKRAIIGFAYTLWLITGIFNCFLLTSSAGVVFLTYYVLAHNLNLKRI